MSKSLSERVADHVKAKAAASQASRNRAAFLMHRQGVESALADGWSLLAIWQLLHEEGQIVFSYQAFRRYAKSLLLLPGQEHLRPGRKNPQDVDDSAAPSAQKSFAISQKPSQK
ncbi:TraK family protein [Pseudomonas aeruginosa]|uniref:TraK family protein n=1 Tax=Pseudomonadaceae TaxID=135621 RepID=UPI001113BC49|nr:MULTISPECIES: TraK family protein [Pseudomonas]EKU8919562.1 TraK family protein [Pseudomonas aeruginosa]EKU9150843.1 TraK family protein [Pseudomonas aeruginosa]EKW2386579.1 TraK family protein [Pseudomonas aeruginosa]ELB4691365.1 TraK family protein [Pseudomonas aeruginosa]MBD1297157.1 TraK family protein [Pseudomonas aeruginosa]